jgi:large subunit ribosomal protein L31
VKEGIHPDYHRVLFIDSASGTEWITRSTLTSAEKREIDGEQVPVVRLEISSVSHPFWTGHLREAARGGKVDDFRRRYGKKK